MGCGGSGSEGCLSAGVSPPPEVNEEHSLWAEWTVPLSPLSPAGQVRLSWGLRVAWSDTSSLRAASFMMWWTKINGSIEDAPPAVSPPLPRIHLKSLTDASKYVSAPPWWLVRNSSIDYMCFLCSKVHTHLKNINLLPSLVASPQKYENFFIHFWRGTNPNVCQVLTLKA